MEILSEMDSGPGSGAIVSALAEALSNAKKTRVPVGLVMKSLINIGKSSDALETCTALAAVAQDSSHGTESRIQAAHMLVKEGTPSQVREGVASLLGMLENEHVNSIHRTFIFCGLEDVSLAAVPPEFWMRWSK